MLNEAKPKLRIMKLEVHCILIDLPTTSMYKVRILLASPLYQAVLNHHWLNTRIKWVLYLPHILEAHCLETSYPKIFHDFPQFLQANAGIKMRP
jgi:hypothetical protein